MTEALEHTQGRIDLHGVFSTQEAVLRAELASGRHAGHPGVQGDATEDHWIELVRKRLPRRYDVSRAIIVDSRGRRSGQMDLVIYDRYYSPQWWEQADHLYIPAESVYAVFEVKPDISRDHVLYASDKIASVRQLHRTGMRVGSVTGILDPPPGRPADSRRAPCRVQWVVTGFRRAISQRPRGHSIGWSPRSGVCPWSWSLRSPGHLAPLGYRGQPT
jgi:hypothetical protein